MKDPVEILAAELRARDVERAVAQKLPNASAFLPWEQTSHPWRQDWMADVRAALSKVRAEAESHLFYITPDGDLRPVFSEMPQRPKPEAP